MIRPARDPFRDHDPFRLYVFVPAIMSAGLLFSIATLLRDAVASRGRSRARHYAELEAAGTAATTLGTPPESRLSRPRRFYAVVGLVAAAMAAYVIPGAAFNYLRPNGYVANIAWVLCLALGIGLALAVTAATGLLCAVDWPAIRPSARWLVVGGFSKPDRHDLGASTRPQPSLAVGILGSVALLTFLAVGVGVGRFRPFDETVSAHLREVGLPWIAELVGGIGATPVSLLVATAIGAVAVRCRTFAIVWITTVAATFAADLLLKRIVERGRPVGPSPLEDSFPSGHIAQVMLLAVAAPVALAVVTDRRWVGRVLGTALFVGAVVGSLERVHAGVHWPTDVLAGAALGLTAGLVLRWVVLHGAWHGRCAGCPWSRGALSP